MQMNGAEVVIKALEDLGVKHIFGYPGGAVLEIFEAIKKSSMKLILVRNEQGAAHAASGYARALGRVGVCLATSGPGATNLVTGIATAYMDSIPIIAITGQVPRRMIGTDAFQEIDITGITDPITKHNYLVQNADDLPQIMAEAFHIAGTGRPGPVLIDIPRDVSQAMTTYEPYLDIDIRSYKPTLTGHPGMIKKAAKTIMDAKNLVIAVGGGVVLSDATNKVVALAHQKQANVVTTMMGIGGYPGSDPLYLGMLGTYGNQQANIAVQSCDCLLALGMRFDDRVINKPESFAKNATIIHVDIDPAEISKNIDIDIPIVGDINHVLNQLSEVLNAKAEMLPSEHLPRVPAKVCAGLNAPMVLQRLHELVDADKTIITTDVGQHQIWAANYFPIENKRSFISSGGLGTMGYGLPAALGAQVAEPDHTVIAISGDGSIQMCMHELGTIMEQELPIKVLIFNNSVLGMVRQLQYHYCDASYSGIHFTKTVDFMKLAEAYGAEHHRITDVSQVDDALQAMLTNNAFTIVECVISADDLCLPIVLGANPIDQMMG